MPVKMPDGPRKLQKFLILFDNTSLLYFPGQFVTGRVLVELEDDTPVLGTYGISYTVRLSNFDRRDRKMGVFLQSTEATPCGHLLK